MELWQIIIAVLGGFIAGVINTFAGNGSAITLSILTEVLGLPGNVANGTNRVGALFQSTTSTYVFYKNGKLNLKESKSIIILTIIGALIGVGVAINIPNTQFEIIFKYLMLGMLVVILVKPKRWMSESKSLYSMPLMIQIPIFLGLGFYGGFIQMGMGIFYLAALVLIAKYDIIKANAVKIFVVFAYTGVVLALFHWRGLVDWKYGSIIAIGQAVGGYLAAQIATRSPKANIWAYRILLVVVVTVVLRLFGLLPF